MNLLTLISALAIGLIVGFVYFHMLWKATKALAAGRWGGLAFGLMIFLRLASVLAILGAAVTLGAGVLEICVAMLGFLAARHFLLICARRPRGVDGPPQKDRFHAH